MNNPMYEAQLNRHEEQIRDIDGRLHSYDLGLRWCEGWIKKLAGDDYSSCVDLTGDKESLEEHNDNQRKEINRLLKANEALKKEIQELKTKLGAIFAEKENVRNELQNSIDWKNRRIATLEQATKTDGNIIDQKNSEISYLKSELKKCKEAYESTEKVKIIEHCCNDVEATKAVFNATQEDFLAREILNENIERLEMENEHLRELYFCTVESSKKIIDKLRKEKE